MKFNFYVDLYPGYNHENICIFNNNNYTKCTPEAKRFKIVVDLPGPDELLPVDEIVNAETCELDMLDESF